ncbi:MAG TPA: pentapeptide repeat-containing protein [Gaiellaceae bacterium]|nr:pentapeptide repeat-containing protein [Gaiellaceae bacterium]
MSKPPNTPYPPDEPKPATELADLTDAEARGADWANERALGVSFQRVALHEVRLTGADLAEAELADVTFTGCRLDLVGLRYAKLQRVVFSDCRMEECDLGGARLEDVLFERCNLNAAMLNNVTVQRVELRECDLAGLQGAEFLRGVRMPWSDAIQAGPTFAAALGIELLD